MYNHIDPIEKQKPLPIAKKTLLNKDNFTANQIIKYVALPMADGGEVIIKLITDSDHLSTFFTGNWPEIIPKRKEDSVIVALKENAEFYGFTSEYNGSRWYSPETQQVWMFGNEYYGNLKITVRGLCSEIAPFEQMFMHGSAMSINGNGVVLSGVSGAGKTTLTSALRRLLSGTIKIVNDDWGPFSFATGKIVFTGEPHLHMKYPSVRTISPNLVINPETNKSENFQGDTLDAKARLLMDPKIVFGENGLEKSANLKMFIVVLRDNSLPEGIRRLTIEDMPLLEEGKFSEFYGKTEWFLNGSLFIVDEERRKREQERHKKLISEYPCYIINNIIEPEKSAQLILLELQKLTK